MHWQQGGERNVEKICIASLEPIPRAKGELVHFFCIFGFWGCGLMCEIGLTGCGNRSDRFCGTSLTGFGNWPDRFVPRVGTCSGGACICAGGALVCFGGLCSLLEHGFVSDVKALDFGGFGVLGLEVFVRVDFRFLLIEWVSGTKLLAKGSP
jgi:hypothetical protein